MPESCKEVEKKQHSAYSVDSESTVLIVQSKISAEKKADIRGMMKFMPTVDMTFCNNPFESHWPNGVVVLHEMLYLLGLMFVCHSQ